MKRREFFGFAASSAVVFGGHLRGDCRQMNGYQACSSTVDIDEASREQECDEFCWAACMQMIFALNGHPVSQESIVRQALQIPNDVTDICVPIGNAPNFRKALSRTYKGDDGKRFKVHIKAFFDSVAGLRNIDNQDVVDALDA